MPIASSHLARTILVGTCAFVMFVAATYVIVTNWVSTEEINQAPPLHESGPLVTVEERLSELQVATPSPTSRKMLDARRNDLRKK